MQSKRLSNISQCFATPAVSGCPLSLRTTRTDVLKICATIQTFITENGAKFICSVAIIPHNTLKSFVKSKAN